VEQSELSNHAVVLKTGNNIKTAINKIFAEMILLSPAIAAIISIRQIREKFAGTIFGWGDWNGSIKNTEFAPQLFFIRSE